MPKSIGFGTRVAWATVFAVVLAGMLGLLLAAKPAHAETFTVDFTPDQSDFDPGDGTCDISNTVLDFCTLRAAIQEANAFPGADEIYFDIPSPGVQTIEPYKELPPITAPVTIDGYTQPGSKPNTNAQGAINANPLVELDGSNVTPFDGLVIGQTDNVVVKGLVINRFGGEGIRLAGSNNRIEGNFIGTNASGNLDLGNGGSGVDIYAPLNTVGGTAPATRNLISGNDQDGILIDDPDPASNNKVQGNLIGTNKAATSALGNSEDGLDIASSSNNTIGGSPTARNTIAFNGGYGVRVWIYEDSVLEATGNRILSNSIHSNGGMGIDLWSISPGYSIGPTANDLKDPDFGGNNLQNKPILTSATTSGGKTTIKGKLNSIPKRGFNIQFFSNPVGDEGETFLGEKYVTTDASGNATFSFIVPKLTVPVGHNVTATATGREGTSEFSRAKSVQQRQR